MAGRVRGVVAVWLAVVVASAVSACTGASPMHAGSSRAVTSPASAATMTPVATPTLIAAGRMPKPAPAASAAARRKAFGTPCPATTPKPPATRFKATIADVDGDGRPDVEWAVVRLGGTIEFGVTTAAGATIETTVAFASGGSRFVSIGTLATGQTVALPTDGHGADLYVLRDCKWIDATVAGTTKQFLIKTSYYPGGWAGGQCIGGRLYQMLDESTVGSNHFRALGVEEHVSANGSAVSTGGTVILKADADSTADPDLTFLGGAHCSPSARLAPVLARS